jgi:hypothetical protein
LICHLYEHVLRNSGKPASAPGYIPKYLVVHAVHFGETKDDFASNNRVLWVSGFVEALMALLDLNPGLDLPADLSRLLVEQTCDFERGQNFPTVPVDVTMASKVLPLKNGRKAVGSC